MRRPLGAPLESRSCGKVIADDLGGWGSVPSTPSYGHGVAVVPEAWYASSRARGIRGTRRSRGRGLHVATVARGARIRRVLRVAVTARRARVQRPLG